MKNIFSQVQMRAPRYNTFNLSHDRKFSMDFGNLTPILCMETVPGDRINLQTSQLVRMAPMIAPIMHQVNCYTHFFFVPNRLLWTSWEDFITGGEDGTAAPVFPTINFATIGKGDLEDFLGLPQTSSPQVVSAMPFAAYQKIYNDYFRDQNLQPLSALPTIPMPDGDRSADTGLHFMRDRAWQHDYFTSALPWTQKGPEATIPLGTTAPVSWNLGATTPNADIVRNANTGANMTTAGDVQFTVSSGRLTDGTTALNIDNSQHLEVDLSSATAATINDLRQAFRLQEWLEKNARGGSRYTESIFSHFGVKSPDARLQRAEFLGGSATPIQISEVLQTSSTSSEPTPQGNMAGHAISVGGSNGFSYYCQEHGFIIGIMSIMPKSAYQQGIPKIFRKFDKFDYYWPSFAHLGEQPIWNYEVYADSSDGQDNDIFGYTPRYAEYKYIPSTVHGDFKDTLDFWHMGRKFASRPALNASFIRMQDDEVDRCFAVQSNEWGRVYVQSYHRIKATRPMPYFGTPRL